MNATPTPSRYEAATELLTNGTPLTGKQKRKAQRDREIHYVSRRIPIDGKIKLERKVRRLPLAKLLQMSRRAVKAQRIIMQASPRVEIPSLRAKFLALDHYKAIVRREIARRTTLEKSIDIQGL